MTLIDVITRSRVWKMIRMTPVGEFIRKLYWGLKLRNKKISSSMDGLEAEFVVKSKAEYFRVKHFVEEEGVINELVSDINSGEVYWDVGANVGTHSVFPALKLTSGHVHAFEPMMQQRDHLRKNLETNIPEEQWTIEDAALFDEDGEATMSVGASDPGSGTHQVTDDGGVQVDLRRADTLIERSLVERPDVVKIDVEGAEYRVLEGMKEQLRNVRILFVEVHPDELEQFGDSPNDVEKLFRNEGFKTERILSRGSEGSTYHLKAERK